MTEPRWKPHVTVAAVVQDAGRYLLVEEETPDGLRLNNPAGHLDPGESPVDAVIRETLEETARTFTPTHLVGLYLSRMVRPERCEDLTFLRVAFAGSVGEQIAGRPLDTGIVRTLWLTPEQIRARHAVLRSPLVLQCLEDHLAGQRLPLNAIHTHASVYGDMDARQQGQSGR
jgi:8-oxo-dGTP pyrophosphatase MutT (NUDIX family)